MVQVLIPLGIRNNNPLNLEPGGWLGELGVGEGGRFARYETMLKGIRAGCRQLIAYQTKRNIVSIGPWFDENGVRHRGVIDTWAPSNENNTKAYIAHVCEAMECQPTDKFNFQTRDFLFWAFTGMGEQENGKAAFHQYVSDADINEGIDAALA